MLKAIPPRHRKWQGRGPWWAFSDADAWHTRISISYLFIYFFLRESFWISASLWEALHCRPMIWTSDHLFSPPFFSQQATWTYKKKSASYSKPTTQMLLCHTGIFIRVHWGTLKDFCSISRLMKVRCCKFTCSEILMRWRDGEQLKSEWSQRCHLETECYLKVHY